MTTTTALETIFEHHRKVRRTICGHLDVLRHLASACEVCVEFGVRFGASTSALLMGCSGTLHSWDIESLPRHHDPLLKAAEGRWHLTIGDSRTAEVPDCDLLFHDTFHNYEQVRDELNAHADKVGTYLIFHDSIKNSVSGGENHTRGNFNPELAGFRLAVDELMIRDNTWHIIHHYAHDDGLLVLERW